MRPSSDAQEASRALIVRLPLCHRRGLRAIGLTNFIYSSAQFFPKMNKTRAVNNISLRSAKRLSNTGNNGGMNAR